MIEADRQEPDAQPCPSLLQVSFARAFLGQQMNFTSDVIATTNPGQAILVNFWFRLKHEEFWKTIFCSYVDFIENMKLADLHLRLYPIIFK